MPIVSTTNGTTSDESATQTVSGTGVSSAIPTSRNTSSVPGYSFPTLRVVRDVDSVLPSKTGGTDIKNVSLVTLLMGLAVGVHLA
jgi:hypothetical protein